jgi:hypothetical protein
MKRIPLLFVVALIALGTALPARAYQPASGTPAPIFTEFCATLLQLNEVPTPGPVEFTNAYGAARLLLNSASRELSYEIEVTGIPSATLAHIHKAAIGVNGPIEIDLLGDQTLDPSTVLSGSVRLSEAQVADLYAGRFYVNIHTVKVPSGELRGQVFPREVTRVFKTKLLGQNEVPPAASSGSGEAIVRLNDARTQFAYSVSVTGTNPISLTHIHSGTVGVNGPVVYNLLPPGELIQPGETLTGTLLVTETVGGANPAAVLENLFNGGLYVNAHSAPFPGGEVRGQLGPASTRLVATLSGANEVPPVATAASGAASMDLSLDSGQLEFAVTVEGITSTIVAAHIHRGAVGVNGPILVFLLPAGETRPGTTTFRGTAYLTTTQAINDALNGQLYVNIHSQAFPGGELRGQLRFQPRNLTYSAALDGAQEVPPVTTDASGAGALTVGTSATGDYQMAYTLQSGGFTSTVTLAHIHQAPAGVNGPVIVDLLAGRTYTGTLTGTVALDAFKFDTMTSGFYYFNIHTQANPGGEIRGQIYPTMIATRYFAGLSGANEVPPVTTGAASGFGELQLDPETQTQLGVTMEVRSPEPLIAAHIHRGVRGENGPIRFDLTGSVVEPGFYAATFTLTPGDVNDLVLQNFYLNVHTQTNPGGAARGQILAQNTRVSLPIIGRNFGALSPVLSAKAGPGLASLPAEQRAAPAAPVGTAAPLDTSRYICGAHGT